MQSTTVGSAAQRAPPNGPAFSRRCPPAYCTAQRCCEWQATVGCNAKLGGCWCRLKRVKTAWLLPPGAAVPPAVTRCESGMFLPAPSAKTSRPHRDGAAGSPSGRRLGCLRAAGAVARGESGRCRFAPTSRCRSRKPTPHPCVEPPNGPSFSRRCPHAYCTALAMRRVAGNGRLQRQVSCGFLRFLPSGPPEVRTTLRTNRREAGRDL
jgi:hypothetical protein